MKRSADQDVEGLLKSLMVLSRSVDEALEGVAVRAAAKRPLSATKARAIRFLGYQDGQTATRLARLLGVSKPAITQLIAALVKGRLVARAQDRDDRREISLQLTPRGRALFHAIRREQLQLLRAAVNLAPHSRVRQWTRTLEAAARALAQSERMFLHFCMQCPAHSDGRCVLSGGEGAERCPFQHDGGIRRPSAAKSRPRRRVKLD